MLMVRQALEDFIVAQDERIRYARASEQNRGYPLMKLMNEREEARQLLLETYAA